MFENSDTAGQPERPGGMRRYPLVVVLAALATGIVLDRYAPVGTVVWLGTALVGLVLWCVFRRRPYSAWLLLMAVMAAGAAWHHLRWNMFPSDDLGRFARLKASPVCVQAVALGQPLLLPAPPPDPLCTLPTGDQSRLKISIVRLRHGTVWQTASGAAMLVVDGHLLGVAAGDQLQIMAQLSRPWPARNPGEFGYADYERSQRRLCRLTAAYPDCVTVLSRAAGWSPRAVVQRLRRHSSNTLWQYLGHPRSGLASAVLLGAREQLERDRVEAFFHTGTIHLLAISGLHVGIMASGFFFVARISLFPVRAALGAAMLCTIMYALLTDARAPVVRAAILVCILCTGWILRRGSVAFNSLAAAGVVVLALNPCQLFRVGTQLSFLAVATLAWFGPMLMWSPPKDPLGRLVYHTRPWPVRLARHFGRSILRLALASVLIWTATLPLVMYRFHLVAPAALVLNVFLWIPIAIALFTGFGVLLLGWLVPPMAALCGWLCDAALWMLESCVQAVEPLSGSYFWVAGPALWWVLGFYVALGLVATLPRLRISGKWCSIPLLVWIAAGVAVSGWQGRTREGRSAELQCTVLAVGHGMCVVLELPSDQIVLYDAGCLGSPHLSVNAISSFLWSRGIHHLDAVVLSHADSDHYNAVPGLLQRFSIAAVYVSSVMFDFRNDALDELHASLDRAAVPIELLHRGTSIPCRGETRLRVLHPPRRGAPGSDNANSIVLDVQFAGRHMILPGDLEDAGLETLLHQQPIDCDVALAPHHGSLHSDPARFATWCSPQWVIVSGGHRNSVAEVATVFQQAGVTVLHTATHGAVRVTLRRTGTEVCPWSRLP